MPLAADTVVKPHRLQIGIVSLYALENNGIRHVSSSLRAAGFRVTEIYFKDWVNNRFPWPEEREVQDLIDLLRRRRVDILGFSVRASAFHRMAKYLTERVRAALGIPIVWGGMHPTFLPELCIEIADYISVGEADEVAVEFFRRIEQGRTVDDCPSFWVRRGDTVYRNDLAPLVDMDTLPVRDYHSHDDKFFVDGGKVTRGDPFIRNPEYAVLASRGCPFWTCSFCSNTLTRPLYEGLGRRFRVRSVENLLAEVAYAQDCCKDIKVIRFDDEVFPIQQDWIEEFAEKWPARVGIPFEVLVDPRMVRREPLRKLQKAGLRAICMGIQATERVNQEFYNRQTTNQQILDAQAIFADLGISSSLQIIWDDPFSTEEDKDQLFHLLMELPRPFGLYLFGLTIYPGTHLARRLLREGRITEEHIEGINAHAFEQFRVDLSYPRPKTDKRWLALIVLCNKSFLSKDLIWRLYRSPRFHEDPGPLVHFAQAVNLLNMGGVFAEMTLRGEMSRLLMKRWINPRSLVTM